MQQSSSIKPARSRAANRVLLAALGGVLLALPCLYESWFSVGWVGFIPILYALRGGSLKSAYLLGTLAGFVFWAAISYWLAGFAFKLKGYQPPDNALVAAGFWLYASQSFGIILFVYQWLRQRLAFAEIFILPVDFVAVFSLYPSLFHMRLREGQTGWPIALQTADITGIIGLDFIMLLTSAALYALLMRLPGKRISASVTIASVLLSAWFGYGFWSLAAWDREISTWERQRIGIVQPNDTPSISIPQPAIGYSRALPPEMEMTTRLAQQGAQLVVWPEARFKGYFEQGSVRDAFQDSVSKHGAAVLFHDLESQTRAAGSVQYNTAALLDHSGELVGRYRKVKRFAFGEYAPVISEIPLLRRWVGRYFGEFLQEITPGDGHYTYAVAGMKLVPKICYESSFPIFMADAIGSDGQGKVIVLLSQDGWFGESRQPFQHLRQSAVRAVENRVPVIHAINNGPSGIILPNGRYVLRTTAFVRSESVADMPYASLSGGSFFSRYPRLFIGTIYSFCALLIIFGLLVELQRIRRSSQVSAGSSLHSPTV